MRILLVSPDPETRKMMSLAVGSLRTKEPDGLDFVGVEDGVEGIAAARRIDPEVIVADEIASRAGAFALARDLRNQAEPFPGVIVILLDRPQDAWLARWSGADAWFVKPADPFELAGKVKDLLGAKEPV
jgi:DNA-binding response OmpR family regulator